MPGKQDPEYFPLNFNLELYDYDYEEDDYETEEGSYPTLPSHGLYENDGSTSRRTRNVSFNEMFVPPENSEVEEDEETASLQSSDIDVDEDVVDTLVLNIREKLRMGPKFNVSTSNHSSAANFWNETSTSSSPYDSNNSGCSSSHSHHSTKRFRVHPYFSSSAWKSSPLPRSSKGSIQKNKSHCRHWWTSKSFSDIRRGKSNPDSPNVDDPYHLLQELVDSGSLIKEAVRRITTKRLGCLNRNTNPSAVSNSSHNNTLNPGPSNARRFAYREDDAENNYPTLPLSAQ